MRNFTAIIPAIALSVSFIGVLPAAAHVSLDTTHHISSDTNGGTGIKHTSLNGGIKHTNPNEGIKHTNTSGGIKHTNNAGGIKHTNVNGMSRN